TAAHRRCDVGVRRASGVGCIQAESGPLPRAASALDESCATAQPGQHPGRGPRSRLRCRADRTGGAECRESALLRTGADVCGGPACLCCAGFCTERATRSGRCDGRAARNVDSHGARLAGDGAMRPTAWLAIALLATLIGALAVWHEERGIEQTREASAHRTFSLLDQQGHTITDQTFRGEWLIVFFGYTSCPDLCPTTLFLLHQTLQKLQGRARSVRVLFITVDPERDTPEKLAAYLLNLGPKFVGGTGTEQQIEAAKQAFRAYSRKQSAGADG